MAPWPFRKKRDPRLFVELLFQASSMYANLPASTLDLGDYGEISKKSGEFIKMGNILKEYPSLSRELGLAAQNPENMKSLFASRKEGSATSLDLDGSIPGIVDCSVKLGWDIQSDRHAVLVMIDPVLHEFSYEGRLYKFIKTQPHLKEKSFVTKIYRCSTYARLLTNGSSGKVYIGFHVGVPIPTPFPVQVGGGASKGWLSGSQVGDWSTGKFDPQTYVYTPLVKLRKIKPDIPSDGWRGTLPPPIKDEDREGMTDSFPPWGELDEDGFDMDGDEDEDDEDKDERDNVSDDSDQYYST